MLNPFRKRFSAEIAPDEPLYVIGDIHGMFDLLLDLLDRVASDAERSGFANPLIVCVGDYTDRGPESRAVLDLLIDLRAEHGDRFVTLMGNHDNYIPKFVTKPTAARRWLHLGGTDTLRSFGIHLLADAPVEELVAAAEAFYDALGPTRLGFLQSLPISLQTGNVFVCHAGTDPDRAIVDQDEEDLLWIRNVTRPRKDGIWTVHGHTIQKEANVQDGRIAIDTGAFATGILTAARIVPGAVTFLQTRD